MNFELLLILTSNSTNPTIIFQSLQISTLKAFWLLFRHHQQVATSRGSLSGSTFARAGCLKTCKKASHRNRVSIRRKEITNGSSICFRHTDIGGRCCSYCPRDAWMQRNRPKSLFVGVIQDVFHSRRRRFAKKCERRGRLFDSSQSCRNSGPGCSDVGPLTADQVTARRSVLLIESLEEHLSSTVLQSYRNIDDPYVMEAKDNNRSCQQILKYFSESKPPLES